jgi:large subunit ribosomal protein L31
MKPKIHPRYYNDSRVICSCGHNYSTGSVKQEIRVEVCYKCHPFFTGEKRYIDTLGQVDKSYQKGQKRKRGTQTQIFERIVDGGIKLTKFDDMLGFIKRIMKIVMT